MRALLSGSGVDPSQTPPISSMVGVGSICKGLWAPLGSSLQGSAIVAARGVKGLHARSVHKRVLCSDIVYCIYVLFFGCELLFIFVFLSYIFHDIFII